MRTKVALLVTLSLSSLAGCSVLVGSDECVTVLDCERFGSADDAWECNAGLCEYLGSAECSDDTHCNQGTCVAGTCVEDDEPPRLELDMGAPAIDAGDDDTSTTPDAGAPDFGEPDYGTPQLVVVDDRIRSHTHWTPANTYLLEGFVYVEEGVTLKIDRGTVIRGGPGSALIVKRGARIEATGSPTRPIVFTSHADEGSRLAGDWGGITILGHARTNQPQPVLEGIDDPVDGAYGGGNNEWDCGTLEYVRIEFAGMKLRENVALNALTLAGCGRRTEVAHVQIHRADEDGISIRGGAVDLRNIVVTRAQGDSLAWDRGWIGKAQFIAVQQDELGEAGFHGLNNIATPDAPPRSLPQISNFTIVGSRSGAGTGVLLRHGSGGVLHNGIIMGHETTSIDVRHEATVAQVAASALDVRSTLFFDIGPGGVSYFEREIGDEDDDGGFDEEDFFEQPAKNNIFGLNPLFAHAFHLTSPQLVPPPASPANDMGSVPGDEFFDHSATYAGAFAPGTTPWSDGWTDYPEN